MKPIIIVQARATSTRFPNKIFADLNGKPVIKHVLDNIGSRILGIPIIVAIPNTESNDVLHRWLLDNRYSVYRGTENDVLGRFYYASTLHDCDTIIRVCADTPLIRASDIMDNIKKFEEEDGERMIYGNGSWVFSKEMLKEAHETQRHAESREHVVRSMFNSIDYNDDIERVEKILKGE